MVVFFAIMATMNLLIGYVIGAYIGWLPGRPLKLDLLHEPLAAPPAPAAPHTDHHDDEIARAAVESPLEDAAPPVDQAQQIQAGLLAFRERLAAIQQQAAAAGDDCGKLDRCAEDMQYAGSKFLDCAHDSLEQLAAHPEHDTPDGQMATAIAQQTATVEEATDQLRRVQEADTAAAKRDLLAESTSQLDASVAALASDLDKVQVGTVAEPSVDDLDPMTGLATLDRVMSLIEEYFDGEEHARPLLVGAVRLDPNGNKNRPEPERLLSGVAELVTSCLKDDQLAAIDESGNLLVLLHGDGVVEGTDRLELVRQKVAATQFVCDGKSHETTITCALTDSVAFPDRRRLLDGLSATMDEAARFGVNRTFHHDGRLPAPVTPMAGSVAGATIEI